MKDSFKNLVIFIRGKTIPLFIIICLSVFLILVLSSLVEQKRELKIFELKDFKSDFDKQVKYKQLYSKNFGRKDKFIAYAKYIELSPGVYKIDFDVDSFNQNIGSYLIQIASEKGKKIEVSKKVDITGFPAKIDINLQLPQKREIEPRILFQDGNSEITLVKVSIQRIKSLLPLKNIFFKSLVISFPLFLLFLALLFAFKNDIKWKYFLALFLFFMGIYFILRNTWISEDAFITIRHVENFLSGYGPVFNIGERVEGFTHVLWFYIVSFLRWIGFSPNGAVILPGFFFSLFSLYIIFFKIKFSGNNKKIPALNFSGAVLIGISAFIDFGTSGLETSLSYFLLSLFALFISKDYLEEKPLMMGLVISFLILNRPDFGVFFIFILIIYLYKFFKKNINLKFILRFLLFPTILVGGYELFRMGYYASMLPNPYYTKSGGNAYFSQGLKYLLDFFQGSLLILILLFSLFTIFFIYRLRKTEFFKRLVILSSGLIYGFFVVRGGGDFMHGRFLLPFVILVAISSIGVFDDFFEKIKFRRVFVIFLVCALMFLSYSITSVQKRGENQFESNFGITDERCFYYGDKRIALSELFIDHYDIMWKTIGQNYNYLSKRIRSKIKIAYLTVGFIGFYSGKLIHMTDKLGLTDPVISRIKISKRGRPGHEKHAPFGYLILRRLTFGDTPFPLWNRVAKTKYGVLWDVSPDMLRKISFFIKKSFKTDLDREIVKFLEKLDKKLIIEHADFIFFLKNFWSKYTSLENRELFNQIYENDLIKTKSSSYKWIQENQVKFIEFYSRIRGKLTFKKFFGNIFYTIKNRNNIHFSEQ